MGDIILSYEDRKKLCETFFGMVEVVVDEFLSRSRNVKYKPYREDFMGIGMITLRKASIKFDPSRGFQFNTYASNAIRYELISYIKKINATRDIEVPLGSVLETDDEPKIVESYDEENDYEGLVEGLEPEDPADKAIYYGAIIYGEPIKDVAKEAGLSKMKAVYAKRRILRDLKDKLGA